jgi:tRNA-dihydrouridine synthase B
MSSTPPNFFIGSIPIYGDLILAPMRGFSDLPYRSICRTMGSAMSYTSFVGAHDLLNGDQNSWRSLEYLPQERPVAFQIYDHDSKRLLRAAQQIQRFGPDIIDINMGCSIRGISGRGAGAGLLRDVDKVGKVIRELATQLDIPISAKIRLGWDKKNKNYLDIAQTIEDQGGSLLAVHARTRDQGYHGTADWDAISEIKEVVTIPVIGNGDVRSIEDIDRLKAYTGCDGIMIGRAAKGNPWIFQRRERGDIPHQEVASTIHLHLHRMVQFYGAELGILQFRKHLAAYVKPLQLQKEIRIALLTCTDLLLLNTLLENIGLGKAR